jgi:hypothetical protein
MVLHHGLGEDGRTWELEYWEINTMSAGRRYESYDGL